MRGKWVSGSAFVIAVAATASPAFALTKAQLDCPVVSAPTGLVERLAKANIVQPAPQSELDALKTQLDALDAACIRRHAVPPKLRDYYRRYIQYRLIHDGLAAWLTAQKVPLNVVERGGDVGPGRTNRPTQGLSDYRAGEVVRALADAGIDIDKYPEETVRTIGEYVWITGGMFWSQAKLAGR
jgi:hypothetical protein